MKIDLREVVWVLEQYQKRMWNTYGRGKWPEDFPSMAQLEMRTLLKTQGDLLQVIGKRDSFFVES